MARARSGDNPIWYQRLFVRCYLDRQQGVGSSGRAMRDLDFPTTSTHLNTRNRRAYARTASIYQTAFFAAPQIWYSRVESIYETPPRQFVAVRTQDERERPRN